MSTLKEQRLTKLAQQEAELIAAAEGKTVSEGTTDVPTPTQSEPSVTEVPTEAKVVSTTEQETKEEPVEQGLDYWKKRALDSEYRFGKYKASTDTTIYQLRSEVRDLRAEKVDLIQKVSDMELATPSPTQEELFKPEVVDVLGTEAVDAIKSVIERTQAESRKTQQDLTAQRQKDEASRMQSAESAKYESFLVALESYVPDCRIMNNDGKFIDWLGIPDATGVSRLDRMRAAQNIGDVERVAQFFNAYKETLKPVATPKRDSIASRVGPTQRSSSSTTEVKISDDTITTSFIRDHQTKVSKGYYKGRRSEQLAIDKRIEEAFLSGKILDK